jgi:hypothetical protein
MQEASRSAAKTQREGMVAGKYLGDSQRMTRMETNESSFESFYATKRALFIRFRSSDSLTLNTFAQFA